MNQFCKGTLAGLFLLAFVPLVFASATNVYITPDGTAQGVCTSNPQTPAWFNDAANWGSGADQIGPGTTVHLCGVFTAAAGSSCYLDFQGGGTSGHPVTLYFEDNALITAPYWSGGAICAGPSFITIDGGTNGTIQATANGTNLANQADGGSGVRAANANNLTIQNLTVSDIYVHACTPTSTKPPVTGCPDVGGQNTDGLYVYGLNNIVINHDTVHDAKWCISLGYPGGQTSTNYTVSDNNAYNCDHSLAVGSGNTNAVLNGVTIDGNTFHDGANWDDNDDDNHHDGIHLWAVHTGSQITGAIIYNNYIYGKWGIDFNAFIYDDDTPGTDTAPDIFNNVLDDQGTLGHYGSGYIALDSISPGVYNNTVIGTSLAVNAESGTGWIVENNIIQGGTIYFDGAPGPKIAVWDYNDYYGCTNDGNCFNNTTSDLQQWQTVCDCDLHSSAGNPLLATDYTLQTGSAAIGLGTNLTSLAIPLLNLDKNAKARSSSAAWDAGAFEFTTAGNPPEITSALTATGTLNTAFSYQIIATNNPISYDATPLPAGLSINSTTGMITGTPTAAGTTNVTISATNSAGIGTITIAVSIGASDTDGGGGSGSSSSGGGGAFGLLSVCLFSLLLCMRNVISRVVQRISNCGLRRLSAVAHVKFYQASCKRTVAIFCERAGM